MGQAIIQRLKSNWSTILIVIILAAASTVPLRAAQKLDSPIDDAYITLVYARSIADGDGFRAHPSADPSLGTTSPLWAIVLAIAAKLLPFVQMDDLAIGLSVWIWIATGWLWAFKGNSLGLSRQTSTIIGVLILIETSHWLIHLGMETRLFCLLLSLCIMQYFEQRYFRAGLLTGLLFLTRGEGILVLGAFAVYELTTTNLDGNLRNLNRAAQRIGRVLLGFGSVALLWSIYALLAIGHILPHTLRAKSFQVELGFVNTFLSHTVDLFTRQWSTLGFLELGVGQAPTPISKWLIIALIGLGFGLMLYRKMLVFGVWAMVFFIGYTFLNAPAYTWYPLPLLYITVIFAGLAIGAIGDLMTQVALETVQGYLKAGQLLSVLLLILIAATIIPSNIPKAQFDNSRHDEYKSIAEWLDHNTPPDTSVAYIEVGTLAYYSDNRVIDLLGLITPEILSSVETGDYAAAFRQSRPDYFVYIKPFGWALDSILYSEFFESHYTPIATLPAQMSAFRGLAYTIFAYNDAQIPPEPTEADYRFDFAAPSLSINAIMPIDPPSEDTFDGTVGLDPFIVQSDTFICADDYSHFVVTMAASQDITKRVFQIFYSADTSIFELQSVISPLQPDDGLHTYTIPTNSLYGWQGIIRTLRLDPVTDGSPDGDNTIHIQEFRLIRREGPTRCTD